MQAYIDGQWSQARVLLEGCLVMRHDSTGTVIEDGPCKVLLGVMRDHDFVAPPSWQGYRELTEK